MSEPVTNAEIEDVLSAVRRLVSETGAPRREERASEMASKLVLTPAFRVDTAPAAEPEVAPVPEAPMEEDVPETRDFSVETLVHDAVETSDTPDTDAKQTPTPDDSHPDPLNAALAALSGETTTHEAPEQEPVADTVAPQEDVAGITESLEDRIAELEAVVTSPASEDWEPDGSEEPDTPKTVLFRHTSPFDRPAAAESEADALAEEASEAEDHFDDLSAASEATDWEDVEDENIAFSSESETLETEDNTLYADADYNDPDVAAGLSGDESPDDMVIDEDMLREIVGRLVREELQGTMGERITRNLRRMVRREIARAMALKDFD
ncbi:hypothetical protein [Maritimibacter sp. UBA3975]|uniref:hypothetical protein n=1 Tax=Maritimibacter sp. UBA3975 TaxID=1946833 RepID=UPI000C097A3B|nr:hypothetical protein [Maritimibacter sp. UBA3975]MAM61437.1 hypothetical protein [Maritimibacter sp.]|tara:strand:- start:14726 stop:15697 length:972 start_codon:yes stop_codon:yes gene_type:complete